MALLSDHQAFEILIVQCYTKGIDIQLPIIILIKEGNIHFGVSMFEPKILTQQ